MYYTFASLFSSGIVSNHPGQKKVEVAGALSSISVSTLHHVKSVFVLQTKEDLVVEVFRGSFAFSECFE